jgi:hypothetical protein
MSIQPVSNNQSWDEFVRIARAAKNRNPDLTAAQPAAKQISRQAVSSARPQFSMPASQAVNRLHSSNETSGPIRYTRILGTRFDAYA